jgi:predicted Zn-ribbon and HTH transcriptional regulator
MFRRGGRFSKAPSLEQMGFEVNDRERTCANCGENFFPVLVTGRCPKCDTPLAKETA